MHDAKERSLRSIRQHLRTALSLCDSDEEKRHIRESLQLLEGLQERCD